MMMMMMMVVILCNILYVLFTEDHISLGNGVHMPDYIVMDGPMVSPGGNNQSTWRQEQHSRLSKMYDTCLLKNYTGNITKGTYSHIVVDDMRKLMYCRIFKVSSTTWRKALVNSSGRYPIDKLANLNVNNVGLMRRLGFRDLNTYTYEEIMYRLFHYFKFIFVRNPFKRLLSAYRDKFQNQHPDNIKMYQKGMGRGIIKKYRKNPSKKSLNRGHDVRFEEFLKYLIASNGKNDNGHWRSIMSNCHPCIINFDFVGKLETMAQDAKYILDKISVRKVHFPQKHFGPTGNNTDEMYKAYYGNVSTEVLQKIYTLYETDIRMFGYEEEFQLLMEGRY